MDGRYTIRHKASAWTLYIDNFPHFEEFPTEIKVIILKMAMELEVPNLLNLRTGLGLHIAEAIFRGGELHLMNMPTNIGAKPLDIAVSVQNGVAKYPVGPRGYMSVQLPWFLNILESCRLARVVSFELLREEYMAEMKGKDGLKLKRRRLKDLRKFIAEAKARFGGGFHVGISVIWRDARLAETSLGLPYKGPPLRASQLHFQKVSIRRLLKVFHLCPS